MIDRDTDTVTVVPTLPPPQLSLRDLQALRDNLLADPKAGHAAERLRVGASLFDLLELAIHLKIAVDDNARRTSGGGGGPLYTRLELDIRVAECCTMIEGMVTAALMAWSHANLMRHAPQPGDTVN